MWTLPVWLPSLSTPMQSAGNTPKIPISARSPWQNCYVERVIGSIRRECLDHGVAINERHLRRILKKLLSVLSLLENTSGVAEGRAQMRWVHDRSSGRIVQIREVGD